MKKVTVAKYWIGLLFRNGSYKRMLTEGNYWLWPSENLELHDTTREFIPRDDLDIFLQDPAVASLLHVVEVKDNQLALMYRNGIMVRVLNAGVHAFWKGIVKYDFVFADISKLEITENIDRATLQSAMLAPYVRSYTVEEYEKAVLFIDGKYAGLLEAGVYLWWKNSIAVNVCKADARKQQMEMNGQEILSKDKAALRLNAYAQYRVVDIELAVLKNKDYISQLYVAFQLALREYVGALTLDELLDKKEAIAPLVRESVTGIAAGLGVEVIGFGIRDIILPADVKGIMNMVLVAEKKAQANIIMRREETASTRSLLNTAKLMEENQMLYKLKEMEYVEKIAEKISSISVGGNGVLIDQLKQILGTSNKSDN